MDLYRAFLAVILSFLVLFGYQYLFVKPLPQQPVEVQTKQETTQKTENAPQVVSQQPVQPSTIVQPAPQEAVPEGTFKDITVETPYYSAVFTENGGGVKSFVLTKFREEKDPKSDLLELVRTTKGRELPLFFSLLGDTTSTPPLYTANEEHLSVTAETGKKSLVMTSESNGLQLERTLTFDPTGYTISISYKIRNTTDTAVQFSPALHLTNQPFSKSNTFNRYQFSGPAYYTIEEGVEEIKAKKLAEGPQVFQGNIQWAGYEDTYFLNAIIPVAGGTRTVKAQTVGDKTTTVLEDPVTVIPPQSEKILNYKAYMGPKKLSILELTDHNLSKAVNFGWFDVIARPTLWLLNFLHQYVKNYGIAIILVTVLIKMVFWPITQKGMKSMKNMQKLQPKIAKLKEKYKDDPTKMNQEMMTMYKTYKVNPVGGCLPMLIQIPVFFALYKVLLQAIELRHAPFMMWITDLSAPDRLPIGIDIPYLGGIPVLTLLMGASMFLQQKMTPTTGDPTQQKIMMMLPIVFTFMFVNFASGLVLYWFINNLLSIFQQQMINRQTK